MHPFLERFIRNLDLNEERFLDIPYSERGWFVLAKLKQNKGFKLPVKGEPEEEEDDVKRNAENVQKKWAIGLDEKDAKDLQL